MFCIKVGLICEEGVVAGKGFGEVLTGFGDFGGFEDFSWSWEFN